MVFRCIIIFLTVFIQFGYACTEFMLINENKNVVVGRSMEFDIDLNSQIKIVPKAQKNVSLLKNNEKGFSWTSKYAYIGLTAFGKDNLLTDGMNEKGLSFGFLIFLGAIYPTSSNKNSSNTINYYDIGDWVLGSFETVEEVKIAMQKINIWSHPLPELKEVVPAHYSFHDKSGKSIVIEFINGKMNILDNPIGVLTNAPNFEWMMTNLSNYVNLTAFNKDSIDFNGNVVNATGQGSGFLGIPGDWTPPSRFVKIALIKNFVQKTKTGEENRNLAFHLLNTIDIPYGAIRYSNNKNSDYTQWVVVKDLSEIKFYYRIYNDLAIKSIDFLKEVETITKPKIFSMVNEG